MAVELLLDHGASLQADVDGDAFYFPVSDGCARIVVVLIDSDRASATEWRATLDRI